MDLACRLSRSVRVLQVYLEGEAALTAAQEAAATSQEKWPPVRAEWRQACKNMHPDWEFKLWNLTAMEALIQERFPWFLPTFQAYPAEIHKGDVHPPIKGLKRGSPGRLGCRLIIHP
jgi:hypothetical protein